MAFTLKVEGHEFVVGFQTRPGPDEYAIRLDRLWFWPALAGAEGGPSVEWSGLPPSMRAVRHAAEQGSALLY